MPSQPEAKGERGIDLAQLVRDMLTGAVGDETYTTQDDVIADVEREVMERAQRPLTRHEKGQIGMAVALDWNRQVENANARAGEARDGKLWAQHEGKFAENN